MFGAVATYLYEYVLGVKQTKDSFGFERVTVSPCYVDALNLANGSFTTCKGEIAISDEKKDGRIELHVNIPAGIVAEITTPSGEVIVKDNGINATYS
jgi:hypothetical protein